MPILTGFLLLTAILQEQANLKQQIDDHMSSGPSRLPNAALRHLEDIEVTEEQLLPIQRTIRIAGMLLGSNDETRRFFLSRNVVTTVVTLLNGLFGLRLETTSSQKNRLDSCSACLLFVVLAMLGWDGVTWVVKAFENGLLSVLLKATDELKNNPGLGRPGCRLEVAVEETITNVTQYMSYYSVITAISTIKGRRNAARAMRAQESGPLKDIWITFFNLMTERCMVQGLLSIQLRKVPIECANVCSVIIATRRILTCQLIGRVHREGSPSGHAQMRQVSVHILLLAILPKEGMETRRS